MSELKMVVSTRQFAKDLKRVSRQGKDISRLEKIVQDLQTGKQLTPRHRPHKLTGHWKPKMECHIDPDWLLIYEVTDSEVRLARTGSHAELFA